MERYGNSSKGFEVNKEQKLNNARHEVNRIVDKLGLGIDEGIKETVAVLRAMDFPTSSSCAGHTEPNRYSPPYIEIYSHQPEGWQNSKEKQEQITAENLKQRDRMLQLLNEFYRQKTIVEDARLELRDQGIYGGFRLQTKGTNMKVEQLGLKTKEDILNRIRQYQKEMSEFTVFIQKKFLQEK